MPTYKGVQELTLLTTKNESPARVNSSSCPASKSFSSANFLHSAPFNRSRHCRPFLSRNSEQATVRTGDCSRIPYILTWEWSRLKEFPEAQTFPGSSYVILFVHIVVASPMNINSNARNYALNVCQQQLERKLVKKAYQASDTFSHFTTIAGC